MARVESIDRSLLGGLDRKSGMWNGSVRFSKRNKTKPVFPNKKDLRSEEWNNQKSFFRRISDRSFISSVSREVAELRAVKNNLEVALDQYHSLDRVEQLALQMGMVLPGSENIRVIYVDVDTEEAAGTVQTASSGER